MRKPSLKNYFIPNEKNGYKPLILREKSVLVVALVIVLFFGIAFSFQYVITKRPDFLAAVITSVLVDLTNVSRATNNLNVLSVNPILTQTAQEKANDMAEKSYFSHVSPDGTDPWYWFSKNGYTFSYAGENLAVNFIDSEDVVRTWMNSAGHRANILSDKFTEIGIAIAKGSYNGRESIYVVQLFGHPAPQAPREGVTITEEFIPQEDRTEISGAITGTEKVEVLVEDKMFIAVKNTGVTTSGEKAEQRPERAMRASIVNTFITSPKSIITTIYLVLGGIVLLSLILLVVIEPKQQFPRNILYAILLLLLIAVLLYVLDTYIFPQILVE